MKSSIVSLTIKLLIALILLQSVYFKLTGSEESKFIFSSIGLEPSGRLLVGFLELIFSIGLFMKRTERVALFGIMALMLGAIFYHATSLGIIVLSDGGLLFSLALLVLFLASFRVFWLFLSTNKSTT